MGLGDFIDIGDVINTGLDMIGARDAQGHQATMQRNAQQFQLDYQQLAPQYMMRGMAKAGLNPILAAKQIGSMSPLGGVVAPPSNTYTSNISTAADLNKTNAETDRTRQQIENLGAELNLTNDQRQLVQRQAEKALEEGNLAYWKQRLEEMGFKSTWEGKKWLANQPEWQKMREMFNQAGIEGRDITRLIGDLVDIFIGKIKIFKEGTKIYNYGK